MSVKSQNQLIFPAGGVKNLVVAILQRADHIMHLEWF